MENSVYEAHKQSIKPTDISLITSYCFTEHNREYDSYLDSSNSKINKGEAIVLVSC